MRRYKEKGNQMFKVISDMDLYFGLVNHANKKNAKAYTNCYLFKDKIDDYMQHGRLFYEEADGGLILYVDEMEYYQAYLYMDLAADWLILPKDKDVVIKLLYQGEQKPSKLLEAEQKLEKSGFVYLDTLRQVTGDKEKIRHTVEKLYDGVVSRLHERGFRITVPDKDLIPQIREINRNTGEVPFWQIPYFTDEELIAMGKEGRAMCIVDDKHELCAIRFLIEKNTSYGYMVIKEAYRKKYGMAVIGSYYALQYMEKMNLNLLGWIVVNNEESVKYNMRLGYQWGNRYTDEWMLRAD